MDFGDILFSKYLFIGLFVASLIACVLKAVGILHFAWLICLCPLFLALGIILLIGASLWWDLSRWGNSKM
jgi:uncharacterized membrane protein